MLNHDSVTPLYEQIIIHLKSEISSGHFAAKSRLPTEEELSIRYQVSRITIRRAVSELVNEGIVEKKQGKGTFVCAPKMHKNLKSEGSSFTEVCYANNKMPSSRILNAAIAAPDDPQILAWLGLNRGDTAVHILRLRYIDNIPCVIEENYFPMKYAYLLDMDLEHDSIYRYLKEEMGIDVVAGNLILRIVHADARTASLLNTTRNAPLLRTIGCTFDEGGDILHTCLQVGYGEDFEFIIR